MDLWKSAILVFYHEATPEKWAAKISLDWHLENQSAFQMYLALQKQYLSKRTRSSVVSSKSMQTTKSQQNESFKNPKTYIQLVAKSEKHGSPG